MIIVIMLLNFSCNMTKYGMSKREWEERLEKFVAGTFRFGRGQRPPKGSERAKKLEKVERCPRHLNTSCFNPFGQRIVCVCGYHKPPVSI